MNDELPVFAPRPVRKTDPQTSRDAGTAVVEREGVRLTLGSHRVLLLKEYASGKEMADWEAAELCGLSRPGVCYWHRVGDLLKAGYLSDTGQTRVHPDTGKARRVLVITEAGREAIKPFLKT